MFAVLGGLGAALAWAGTTLCAARSSKILPPTSVLAWVMIFGLAVAGPAAGIQGLPQDVSGRAIAWLVIAGCGNVGGLLLTYAALRTGKVGVVAPIVSTEGAIAAVVAVVAGEHLAASSALLLAVIVIGIVATGVTRSEPVSPSPTARPVLLAMVAAGGFGASLYATGRAGAVLPIFWAVLPARVVGVVAVALPLIVSRRLRLSREAVPYVVAGGVAEVVGFVLYALGARHGLAISAVLASQFGGISALIAFVLFRERLLRVQVAGVVLIAAGVAALTVLQA